MIFSETMSSSSVLQLDISFFTVRVWRRESSHSSSMLSSKPLGDSEQKLPLNGNHPISCAGKRW
jgi:hypothetical protein